MENNLIKNHKILYTMEEIQKRIKELGEEISNDYKGEELIVVCILKGAAFFTTDLVKNIDCEMIIDFMRVSSYTGTESSGIITLKQDLEEDIEGKNVLIVEDIIDTGRTLNTLKTELLNRNPKSLKVVTLLDKKERRVVDLDADYVGFSIPNKFVVGYGFDIDEKYRNIPYIGYIEN